MSDTNAVRLDAQVRIVGTGLLGASIGLALRSQGIDVALADSSPSSVHLASDLGAGRPAQADDQPKIIVVCVPPDVTADVIEAELKAFPDAVVTDVASVKLSSFASATSSWWGHHPLRRWPPASWS